MAILIQGTYSGASKIIELIDELSLSLEQVKMFHQSKEKYFCCLHLAHFISISCLNDCHIIWKDFFQQISFLFCVSWYFWYCLRKKTAYIFHRLKSFYSPHSSHWTQILHFYSNSTQILHLLAIFSDDTSTRVLLSIVESVEFLHFPKKITAGYPNLKIWLRLNMNAQRSARGHVVHNFFQASLPVKL